MDAPKQAFMENKLLALLPEADYADVAPHLEFCKLPRHTRTAMAGEASEHIYFLTKGIGSVVVVTGAGTRAEAGVFGAEGYVPAHVSAGVKVSPHDVFIQVEAEAYRMSFDAFQALMDSNRNFRKIVQRSVSAFTIQLSYTAASNALHDVDERLARWLLMYHDRMSGDELHLTHDFMALMLGVRRPSVTTALHVLEGYRFIKADRGMITIRDREAMQDFAQEAYGTAEEEYERLMSDLF